MGGTEPGGHENELNQGNPAKGVHFDDSEKEANCSAYYIQHEFGFIGERRAGAVVETGAVQVATDNN